MHPRKEKRVLVGAPPEVKPKSELSPITDLLQVDEAGG